MKNMCVNLVYLQDYKNDEADSRFSEFCEKCLKYQVTSGTKPATERLGWFY